MNRMIKVIIAIIVVLIVFIVFSAYEVMIGTHGGFIYTWIKGSIEFAVICAMFAWAFRKKQSPSDNKEDIIS